MINAISLSWVSTLEIGYDLPFSCKLAINAWLAAPDEAPLLSRPVRRSFIIGRDAEIVERTQGLAQLGSHPTSPLEEPTQMLVIDPSPVDCSPNVAARAKAA